jgi:hypothetical protein
LKQKINGKLKGGKINGWRVPGDGREKQNAKSQASHRGKKCTSRRDGRDV